MAANKVNKVRSFAAAAAIIDKLRAAGHVALLAGGCVRDQLLNLPAKDYDVATDAVPTRVVELFPRARLVGAKFGVVLVRQSGCDVEVATFRADGPYSDGRHPDEVHFGTEREDANRRDFTVNGLFLDPVENRVIDHVGGQADLAARIIRTIGDPHRRFGEDHLRMLRAVRFAARLDFRIDSATMDAIRDLAAHLRSISAERIGQELEQILTAPSRAAGWRLLRETGLRGHLCAKWTFTTEEDERTERRLASLPLVPVEPALAFAAALAEKTSGECAAVGRALRWSNRLIRKTVWLVASLPKVRQPDRLELADLKMLMADEAWILLPELLRADLLAWDRGMESHEHLLAEESGLESHERLLAQGKGLDPYHRLMIRASAIRPEEVAPPPLLSGEQLSAMGLAPGPRFGEVLKSVYRAQLNEIVHTPQEAVELAKRLMAPSGPSAHDTIVPPSS